MGKSYFLLFFVFFILLSHNTRSQETGVLEKDHQSASNTIPPPRYNDVGDAPNSYLTDLESEGPEIAGQGLLGQAQIAGDVFRNVSVGGINEFPVGIGLVVAHKLEQKGKRRPP